MAFLTFGAITVRASRIRRLQDERGGQPRRTIGGQLRGDPLWTARAWEVDAVCINDTEANNLHGICTPFGDATVAGDAIGSTITARLDITGDEYQQHEDGWYRTLTISIREQVS